MFMIFMEMYRVGLQYKLQAINLKQRFEKIRIWPGELHCMGL